MQHTDTEVSTTNYHLNIADMTPGTRVDGTYAIINPQVSASRTGKPFLKCMLRDATGRVSGRMWSVDPDSIGSVLAADFAFVSGCCENFNDSIQVKVESVRPAEVDSDELRILLPTAARHPDEMMKDVRAVLETLTHPAAKVLATAYLEDDSFVSRFAQAPAAKSLHHAYLSGLLDHTLQLLRLADSMLPFYPELDRDLVLLGVFLHDSGKVLEFDAKTLDYSRRGNLLGHLLDGVLMLEMRCARLRASGGPTLPDTAKVSLQHIIASHHGTLAFGAIKAPATPEAVFVSRLDDLDAKTRIALDVADREGLGGGDFTEMIGALEGARIYRGKPFPAEA